MGPKMVTTPIKPPKFSSMTREENEDIQNMLSKLEEQIQNVSEKSNNWVKSQKTIQVMEGKMVGMEKNREGIKNNMDDMENKMEENKNDIKKEIQNSLKEMQNMSSLISQDIDGRFPKGDIKMEWTHENKGSTHVEQTANNKTFSESNSNCGVNSGGAPKFNFPKIELKKFDGT
jgi:predicted  nucleic acid-binding Zn-ribbon protein